MTAAERFVKRMLGGVFGDKPSEVVEKRGLGEENGDEEQKNGQADNQKVDEKPAKTAQDSLYEALVADESPKDKTLAEHDKERHPNGFNPETDSCKFREELKKETETDKGDEVDVDRGREEGIEVDGEGKGKKPLVTPEEDKAYMDAVERGDMDTAEKMVREVAGRAFPNTKIVKGDGLPWAVYHGTDRDFSVFDTEVGGDTSGVMGTGAFFTSSKKIAEAYSRNGGENGVVKKVFLNMTNPFVVDANGAMYDNIDFPAIEKKEAPRVSASITYAVYNDYPEESFYSPTRLRKVMYFKDMEELQKYKSEHDTVKDLGVVRTLQDIIKSGNIKELLKQFIDEDDIGISRSAQDELLSGKIPFEGKRFLTWYLQTEEGEEVLEKAPDVKLGSIVQDVQDLDPQGVTTNDIALYVRDKNENDGLAVLNVVDVPENIIDEMESEVAFSNQHDGGYHGTDLPTSTDFVVFDGSNIKSADPVTYDDDGNVIPLSRRFDDGNDIRGDVSGGTSSSVRHSISDDGEEFGDSFYGEVYPDRKKSYSSEFGKDDAEDGEKAAEAYRENFTKDGKYKSPFEGGRFRNEILEKAREGQRGQESEVWDEASRANAEAAGRVLSGILGGVSFMLAEKPYSGREEVDTRFNPENHDIRFKNPAGKVVGEYNRATNKITLYPGAKIKDVVHEYSHGLWQFAEQEAKAGRDGLQKKLHQIAHAAPEKVKEAVGRSYYDQDPNVVLEECFTHEMARRSEKNKAFAEAIKTASGKNWYKRAWGAIKDTWKGFASKFGFNKADTSRIDDMTSGEAADYILTQMAQGKKFGNVSGEDDSSTETRMAKESSNSDTYVLPSGRKIPSAQKYLHTDTKGNPHDEMWSVFLEKQTGDGRVSQEFSDVVEGLFSGKDIDADTIKSLPEWKKAMEREKEIQKKLQETHGIDSTVKIQTEERERFRDAIIRAAMSDHISKTVPIEGTDSEFETNEGLKEGESYDVEKGRNICIVIGLPAAGKSTSFANPLAKKFKARLCDSDTIKKVLPEFNNGYGGNLVHEESTMLNEEILNRSIEQGDNIVYPILGYKPEKLENMFKMLRDKGYKINLCLKDMPANIAKGRLLGRFLSKGRYLPIECITKAQGKFADCFERVKGLVDAYVRATSDIDGSNERIIEKKGDLI